MALGSPPPWRDVAAAALAAAAVVALAVAGAVANRELALERRARADGEVVAAVAAGAALDLERSLEAVSLSARNVALRGAAVATGTRAAAAVPAPGDLGFVPEDRAAPGADADSPLGAEALVDPAVAALLDRARDSGEAIVSAPIEIEGRLRTLLVAAAYSAGPAPGAPSTAPERRERLLGWVVLAADLPALVRQHAPDGQVAAVVDATATPLPERLPEQTFEIRGHAITVTAGDPTGVATVAAMVPFLAAGLLGGGVAAAAVYAIGRRLRRQDVEIERSADQVRLIGDVAPLVQQSLELGEVLPAVAVQLSDHFGLTGVRLSTGASRAGQLELFSLGERSSAPSTPLLRPPTHLAAGEGVTLALQRGGRSVALLELVAGRDLDESDLQSLRTITELVTAAVVNASLYASQQAAVRRLRDLDTLKTVFLSTASHELRTPITAIGGFAKLLTSSWDAFTEEQRRDFLARIESNARSLDAVVQELLDFSLLDREAAPLHLEPIELGRLVQGVVDRLAPTFGDRVARCTTEPAPTIAGTVNGLERVVTNLVTNAAKFSPDGSTITVSVGPARGGTALVVSDQGPGVPAEERQRVFARFYRGSGDAVLRSRGVGIGLSVASELVSRMHGEITVDDAPGGGARFTVWLPANATPTEGEETHDAATR